VVGPRQALAAVGPYLIINYYNKWLYLCGMCREWILGRTYSSWTGRQGRATVITPMTTRRRIILANVAAALGVPLLLMGAWQAAPLLASAGLLAGLAAWSATFPWRGKGRRRNGADGA
jgi:hypothetical protein